VVPVLNAPDEVPSANHNMPTTLETGKSAPVVAPMSSLGIDTSQGTNKEYVDICELLPKTWWLDNEAQGGCCQSKRPRRGMITDFQVWSEC